MHLKVKQAPQRFALTVLNSLPLIPFQELILAATGCAVNLLRFQKTYRGICSLVACSQGALLIQHLDSQQSLVLLLKTPTESL